jgi:hypothetical protein
MGYAGLHPGWHQIARLTDLLFSSKDGCGNDSCPSGGRGLPTCREELLALGSASMYVGGLKPALDRNGACWQFAVSLSLSLFLRPLGSLCVSPSLSLCHQIPLSPSPCLGVCMCVAVCLSLSQSLTITQAYTHKECTSNSSHCTACLQGNDARDIDKGASLEPDYWAMHPPLCKHAVQMGVTGTHINNTELYSASTRYR